MILNINSWHYKLWNFYHEFLNDEQKIPHDFCEYYRTILIYLPFRIVAPIFIIVGFLYLMITSSVFLVTSITLFLAIFFFLSAFALIGFSFSIFEKHEIKNSFIYNVYKSKKEKYCSVIELRAK